MKRWARSWIREAPPALDGRRTRGDNDLMMSVEAGHPRGFDEPGRFETLLADLSSTFIDLPPGDVDRAIHAELRRVCEFLSIDLAVLWRWSISEPRVPSPTHVYWAAEASPARTAAAGALALVAPADARRPSGSGLVCGSAAAGGLQKTSSTGAVTASSRACAFRSGRRPEAPRRPGVQYPAAPGDWPQTLVQRLRLVAQVFAHALAGQSADEALRESEARLGLAADAAEAGLWTLDYGTGVFWVTPRARAIFGYSPDEVVDLKRFEASVHPDDWHLLQSAIERSARLADFVDVEYRICSRGSQHALDRLPRAASIGSAGEPQRLMGVSIDVTQTPASGRGASSQRSRLAVGTDLADLAFYELDYDNRSAVVDGAVEIACVPPDRARDFQFFEVWQEGLHPDDRPRVLEIHSNCTTRIGAALCRLSLSASDPRERMDSPSGPRPRATPPGAQFAPSALYDITERKRARGGPAAVVGGNPSAEGPSPGESDYLKAELRVTTSRAT